MLFLVFHLGPDRYAIPAKNIHELVPFANLKHVPLVPDGIAGILNYHGKAVPIADLVLLACGKPAAVTMTTRIILLSCIAGESPALGLIAENVIDVRDFQETSFQPSGVESSKAPWLGKVINEEGLIQWIHPEKIFSSEVLEALILPKGSLVDI